MKRKIDPFFSFKLVKDYWPIATVVVGFISACTIFPFKLNAAEKRIDDIDKKQQVLMDQTTQIGKYIEAIEKEKELKKKAPLGYKWDEIKEMYEPDPDFIPPTRKKDKNGI